MSPEEISAYVKAAVALIGSAGTAFGAAVAVAWRWRQALVREATRTHREMMALITSAEKKREEQEAKCASETKELRDAHAGCEQRVSDLRVRVQHLEGEVRRKISPAFPMPAVKGEVK